MTRALPRLIILCLVATLAACAAPRQEMGAAPDVLSNMRLAHVAIIADKAVKSPVSRDASPEEWDGALRKAVMDRFGRIEGNKYYHLGIFVDGYALAPPGVPLVASPKSVLVISVTLFDDAKGGKVNEKPKQFTIFESLSGDTVVGTGLTKTREQQLEALAFNAAVEIERWLLENPDWFPPAADAADPAAAIEEPA